jgi:hypothetical protein
MGNIFNKPKKPKASDQNISTNTEEQSPIASAICDSEINKIVDMFMLDRDINQQFIPDVIERKIYFKAIKILLHLIKQSVSTAQIEFMGHTISLSIHPTQANE